MRYVVTVRGEWQEVTRALGISYRDLGRMTGRSLSTVKSYAIGRRVPPREWLDEVSAILARHGGVERNG